MGGRLKGRSALVTGSGRGIGRSVALALAAEGASVVVNDPGVATDGSGSDQVPAEQVAGEIRQADGIAVANFDSVADAEGAARMVRQCVEAFGRIDCLINVAGIIRDRMVFNMSEEEWDAVIAVHLKGHFNTITAASPLMREGRFGRIVNFSSISGLMGNAGQANYGAAKAAIAGLTRALARDLGQYGITTNAVSPAASTRMTALAGSRLEGPDHIAPMVVYLCTDDAWNVNGKIFQVAGGSVSLMRDEDPYREVTKDSPWTAEETAGLLPGLLFYGVQNPAPPPDDLDLPGRPAPASS